MDALRGSAVQRLLGGRTSDKCKEEAQLIFRLIKLAKSRVTWYAFPIERTRVQPNVLPMESSELK